MDKTTKTSATMYTVHTGTRVDQIELEKIYSKHQLLDVLRKEYMKIANEYPDTDNQKFLCETMVQMFLHRQADPVTLVGVLSPKYGFPQEVADKLLVICDLGYIDFDTVSKKFIVKYDVSLEIQEKLKLYQYPLPMITKPKVVKDNLSTGYETVKGLIVLNGSKYFLDKDMCLDHINRSNSVPLELNMECIYSDEGKYVKPNRKPGEDFMDYSKRLKQSSVFYDTSVDVMIALRKLSKQLYLTYKYDRRGRTYCSGYHVSTQGTDYNKAVLEFAHKEIIT